MMFDVPADTEAKSAYECLACGEIVARQHNPMTCPECGQPVQNRAMSLE